MIVSCVRGYGHAWKMGQHEWLDIRSSNIRAQITNGEVAIKVIPPTLTHSN